MALLGAGVAAIWHNVEEALQKDYNHWHCHEHMAERVGIPGFRRGRRYVAIEGEPEFFHFYETESLATLTSPEYLARLNTPTPWTRHIGPHIRDNNRTLSTVVASYGNGVGAAILTGRLAPLAGREAEMRAWLAEELFPDIVQGPGVVAAHLLRGDDDASNLGTEEKAMRETRDAVADWVVLVEALEPDALVALCDGPLAADARASHGLGACEMGLYRLHFVLGEEELGPNLSGRKRV